MAYVPIGPLEWHGPHLPVGVDMLHAHAMALEEEFGLQRLTDAVDLFAEVPTAGLCRLPLLSAPCDFLRSEEAITLGRR